MLKALPFAVLSLALAAGCKSPEGSRTLDDAVVPGTAATAAGSPMSVEAMIERAKARPYWPDKTTNWQTAPQAARDALMTSPACQEFAAFVFPAADADAKTAAKLGVAASKLTDAQLALRTDGLMVVKNGVVLYENYTGPYATDPDKLHCMWSASKSFTAGVVGAVAQSGRTDRNGQPIGLATKLKDLMDPAVLNQDPRFAELTVEHFLAMAPNIEWRERYEEDIQQSSIVHMLWLDGYKDMSAYAANQPFGPEGPGNKFIYSSGNALILMRAMQAIYGDDYETMPWTALFDRLGMRKVAFERDRKGVFVGSSYVHTTLRDMAKFGYAYLNGGYYKDKQVIHPDFVRKARELSLGMAAPGTSDQDIEHEEAFYGLGFWLNADPQELQAAGVRSFGPEFRKAKFFPSAPTDMFFAAGHYGQNILIFPQDDLMVVRFSHDKEYWTKLDRMMSLSRACFNTTLPQR